MYAIMVDQRKRNLTNHRFSTPFSRTAKRHSTLSPHVPANSPQQDVLLLGMSSSRMTVRIYYIYLKSWNVTAYQKRTMKFLRR